MGHGGGDGDRKSLVMKARIDEIKHTLRSQLEKEKKHQWYIYKRKNFPMSKDVKTQRKIETAINPDNPDRGSPFPFTSVAVASVGLVAGYLLMGNHINRRV